LNNKGQFSIIAALLVAVVLISTVMITYSTIRNSPIQDQPQVLSAIDETNFAIKQILGFTVGYYCSVLQVTGNSSYARMLALNYLHSGLINIANMHPEWGPSFELNETETELLTYWFTNTSYSTGTLAITYDLTGLGIYGITYETSCKLTVQVKSIISSNRTQLAVMKDEGEPLINLGKNNFKFYRYRYTNLTWELITPDTEPTAFANGTYIIDIPSEIVDPYSYVIQVEDQRGLIVVASSFSRYTCTLAWNSTAWAQHYVDNNTSNVDSSAGKGTHSNFQAQQAGPDSLFDTLTEEDTLGSWGDYSSELLVNPGAEFGDTTGWTATGPNAANFVAGYDCSAGSAGPHTGSYAFYWNRPSSSSDWAYQEVDLSPWFLEIQSGEAQITAKGWLVCSEYHVPPWDIVRMKVVFYDNSSQEISSATYDTGERGDLQVWTEFGVENYTIPTNAVKVRMWFQTFENGWDSGNADDFTVKVRTYNSGGNSELDLEVQWTNVNYNRTNEELCICAYEGNNTYSMDATGGYMVIGDGTPDWGSTTGTISFWIQWDTVGNRPWGQHGDMETRFSGSNLVLDWGSAGSITSSTSFTAGKWYFIAIVWDENTDDLYLYVGDEDNAPTEDTHIVGWTDTVSDEGVTENNFMASKGGVNPTDGQGDDLRYWNIDRTLAEIQSDYDTELTGSETNLRSYFKLNNNFDDIGPDNNDGSGSGSYLFQSDVPFDAPPTENLRVDVWTGSVWQNLFTNLTSGWNNVSVSSYLDSSTFTIRFKGANETGDTTQDGWKIDATLLHLWPTEDLYLLLQDATIVVELLQNGTMRWLGQNLQLTTQVKPIPPIPVKAIHVNQTINGINREVPFQIEDWASDYRIPLGLTSNASVFNSRTMLVFLVNPNVSKVTIWWNGSDTAIQTSYAITNKYFTFNTAPSNRTLSNGILTLKIDFSDGTFRVISTVNTSEATAVFMRINNEVASYGHSEPMYAVLNGTVRIVLQHEVEWSGGIPNCPNVYAHIVLTLPANATYYTYQLRFMFVESQLDRTITDLCPIEVTASTGQPQTENGTAGGYPIVSSATGLFYNFSASSWAHHWSQFISGTKGAGIMFTGSANQRLYIFDTTENKTGALKVSNSTDKTIELLPVAMASVNFTSALDVSWHGAVVTFDGTTPVYKEEKGTGLWMIVEYPPTITVTTEN